MTNDLMAWLGPAADDMTPEQISRVAEEAARIGQRYPDPDEHEEREAALSAAVQYILGETTAEDAAAALSAARSAQYRAFAAALQVGTMLVADAGGKGKSSSARRVGVDRMSLLKALGERER